jgi:GTP:adenosylcobinamide-phosphate guanylyltransferase
MIKWDALILAGDRGPSDPVAQAAGVSTKAFAPIAGRPMIEYVVDALRSSGRIGDIAVSIAPDAPALPDGLIRLDMGPTPATSGAAGVDVMGTPLLITTADHPLLTPEMVQDFLTAFEASGAEAAAACSLRVVVEKAGNDARRTYLKFSDGWVSGCNLFALRTPDAVAAVEFWKDIEAHRKKPLTMARKIGLLPLALYAVGRLSREAVAKHIGDKIGVTATTIALNQPNAAHDVDKATDMAFAELKLIASGGDI